MCKKILLRSIPIIFVILVVISNSVFGFDYFENTTMDVSPGNVNSADKAVRRIWGTVTLILQILAVAGVVMSGIRYMFSSADVKAAIKGQTLYLVLGCILVFAASTVIKFITEVAKNVTGV